MFKRALSGAAFAVLLAAGVSASPAHAQSGDGWKAAGGGDHCDLGFYRDDMTVFMIRSNLDESYSLSGEVLGQSETGWDSEAEVSVRAGRVEFLLSGSAQDMQQQAERSRAKPLDIFARFLAREDSVTLAAPGGAEELPLDTYPSQALAFYECRDALARTITPRGPRLISFTGINQLTRAASRERVLSQPLTFILEVDAEGNAIQCTTTRHFRRAVTQIGLCRPVLKYTRFDPARDAAGNPVAGSYQMPLDYNSLLIERDFVGWRLGS